MEKKVALLGILAEDAEAVSPLNELLHEYGGYIIGRMGLPYRKRQLSIISIAMDAPPEITQELAKKVAEIKGIRAKIVTEE